MKLHVKLLKKDGLDGPEGWPSVCVERDDKAPLSEGFDAIMTQDEIYALQAELQARKDALIEEGVAQPKGGVIGTET